MGEAYEDTLQSILFIYLSLNGKAPEAIIYAF